MWSSLPPTVGAARHRHYALPGGASYSDDVSEHEEGHVVSAEPLLLRLARAIASTPSAKALTERLCLASRDLAGADAAALSVVSASSDRVLLHATEDTAARLEDLQEVLGEGPGTSAATSGELQVCRLVEPAPSAWPRFAPAARDLAGPAAVHAVPMRPNDQVFGVLTLYRFGEPDRPLAMDGSALLRLAAATGAAVVRDPDATSEDLASGPWHSRARVHQATGMVVVQLGLGPDDALAVLRAHAYAGDTTLDDVAGHVLDRTLRFHPPRAEG